MKHTITSQLAVLLLFAAGMAGCSEEDALPGGTSTNPDSDRCPITVSVSDGGYMANAPSAPGTRAVEEGYTTRFTAGDKIGLYAVKDGAIVASNICLTAETGSSGNGIAWQVPEGTTLYYEGAGTKYFAYYPWQPTLSGSPDASATDASGFFANVISQWIPATDQGTYAKYTAQDLMTGSSTPGSKQPDGTYSLSFTLTHAMALVVIETPTTKYKLTDASGNSLPDYNIPAPDTRFYGFTPCSLADTYRYLVKPSQSGAGDLMGSYTATTDGATATKEYAVTQNGLTAASYALYKVDNATVTETSHTLQVGDFYLSDGSLVGKDAVLSDAQQAACIGIVYSTDVNRIGAAATQALKDKGVSTPHGLVMALTNASDGCRWGEYNTYENSGGVDGEPFKANTDQLQKQYRNVDGYGETHWIIDHYKNSGTALQNTYTAFYHANRYGTAENSTEKYAVPSNTTGWFIPGMGQWWDILSNLGGVNLNGYQSSQKNGEIIKGVGQTAVDNMNTYLQKISGATPFSTDTYFWSSSEYSGGGACYVFFYSNGDLALSSLYKGNGSCRVRCSFAF